MIPTPNPLATRKYKIYLWRCLYDSYVSQVSKQVSSQQAGFMQQNSAMPRQYPRNFDTWNVTMFR